MPMMPAHLESFAAQFSWMQEQAGGLPPTYFAKYQALGNSYLICDGRHVPDANKIQAKFLCDSHYGIGADGILWWLGGAGDDFTLAIMNPDGSFAEKSGNGLRIMARWLWDTRICTTPSLTLQVGTFVGQARIVNQDHLAQPQVGVTMGKVQFGFPGQTLWSWPQVPKPYVVDLPLNDGTVLKVTPIDLGNPHCVIWTGGYSPQERLRLADLVCHHAWFPQRCNVQWLTLQDQSNAHLEIVERGAGVTLASGSSACAAAAAGMVCQQLNQQVTMHMAGGALYVQMDDGGQLYQQGDVVAIAQGLYQLTESSLEGRKA